MGCERKVDANPGTLKKALAQIDRLVLRFGGNCDGR